MQTDTILFRETTAVIGWLLFLILQSCIFLYIRFPPPPPQLLPHNYSLTTHDKQKITSLKNYNPFPYCQLKFPSSKQPQSHVIITYSVYANKAVATITNVVHVLSEFQLMIGMEGIKKCFVVWLLLNFHSARNCDSFYSLALYQQVLLVHIMYS